MPCYDSRTSQPPPLSREEFLERKMSAVLCGIVSVIGFDEVASMVNWPEAGVTKDEFQEWWATHRGRDERRRAREVDAKRRK